MAATTLLTSEQFLALPEEFDGHGNRIKLELTGGEVVRMPPPSPLHDLIKNKIHELLMDFLRAYPRLGLRSLVEIGTQVGCADALTPDVSVVKRASLSGESRIYPGSPEIAIEVVSPNEGAAYLRLKTDAYLANGSRSVWIVFSEVRSVMIYTRDSIHELRSDQRITDALLPAFSSPVSACFELT